MRIASSAMATPRRDDAKPGASLTTTAVLPKASTQPFAVSTKASGVDSAMTTSTSFEAGTGLKKCRPITSLATVSASWDTDSDEVFVAMTVSGAAFAILLNAVVFSSIDSGTASTTRSKPANSDTSVESRSEERRVGKEGGDGGRAEE